jgi:hypothetical protein
MGDAAEQEPFEQIAERLLKELVEEGCEGEAPESVATAYLDYVIKRERIRRDATDAGQRQDAVDHETLLTLKNADSDDPQQAHAMLTFQRLGVDPIKAVEYVERLITSRQTEISQKMKDIANKQRPMGRKPFRKIIDEIVRQNPSISRNSLLQRLKRHEEINVIDNKIICHEPHDEMPVSGLSQALSRSKARLLKISKKHSR